MDCLKKQNSTGGVGGRKNQKNSSASNQQGPSTSRAVEEDVAGPSTSRGIDVSPAGLMKFLNLGSSNDDDDNITSSADQQQAEGAQDGFRMSEDGYPLVVDLGPSERQNQLARERLIEEVIQEQEHGFDQDIVEELARANLQRVFEEEDEEQTPQQSCQRVANAIQNLCHNRESYSIPPSAEASIANYLVRKYSEQNMEMSNDLPSQEESRAINILPASRNLELPVNSLVAFGRRPSPSSSRIRRVANAVENSPLGWQASKTMVKDRIEYMFCNDLMADVYFFVGREDQRQRIPAHKFVLSIGSVVFDAMFNGGLTPHNSREPLEIELPDVEPSAFQTLLKFLYTDNVKIEPENVMTTLYTAKKYAVPAMESACVDFLKKSLGADNAFMLLTQARLFDEPQLEHLCLELIDKNTHEALAGEGFTDIDVNTLCVVLARDTLRVREALLFQAVVRWANEECSRRGLDNSSESRRTVLGGALQLIRFPLMTIEEFAQSAAQSGLLTDREVVNLFLYYTINPKPSTTFNDRPRSAMSGKELVVCRFQRNEVRWGYSGVPDRIKFTVDRPIYVIGFGLYGGISGPQEYPVTIQIIHCGTGKVMAQNETSFVCDGSSSTFRVLFRDPIEITPSVTYIASAFLKGQDSHYGTKGLRRIVHQSANGTVTFQFTYAAGNNNGTSVEDGQIPEIIFYTKHA